MKTVGFIGAYDKIDLILYVAKILVATGKKVLVVDSTILQKGKYVVPAINPTKAYVTEYEGIDVAVGFEDFEFMKDYLGMSQQTAFHYDYAFIDIDTAEMLKNFEIEAAYKNYFVTGMDTYSLKRGLEIMTAIEEPMPVTKIIFSKNISKEEDEYLTYLSLGYKVQWNNEKIYFPFEMGDQTIIQENQRVAKIRLKKLTEFYKESLIYLAQEILDNEVSESNLKKAVKQIERGV